MYKILKMAVISARNSHFFQIANIKTEFYLQNKRLGTKLYNFVKEVGQKYNIGPGCPNLSERVESGLLSFGGDTDHLTNPFEVRLGNYVDLDLEGDIIGLST